MANEWIDLCMSSFSYTAPFSDGASDNGRSVIVARRSSVMAVCCAVACWVKFLVFKWASVCGDDRGIQCGCAPHTLS